MKMYIDYTTLMILMAVYTMIHDKPSTRGCQDGFMIYNVVDNGIMMKMIILISYTESAKWT